MTQKHLGHLDGYTYEPLEEHITHLNLASALHARGHKIITIDNVNNGNKTVKVFIFQKTDELNHDVSLYRSNKLYVSAVDLFNAKDHLKNIINQLY
jgi:hypothetical protein